MSWHDGSAEAFYAQRDADDAYRHAQGAEAEMFRQMDLVHRYKVEVERLAAALHRLQKHPDFNYSMTVEGKEEHHTSREGWEPNPAIGENGRIVPHNMHRDAELYWMRPKATNEPTPGDQ